MIQGGTLIANIILLYKKIKFHLGEIKGLSKLCRNYRERLNKS